MKYEEQLKRAAVRVRFLDADRSEQNWRKGTRPAQAGNNRAAVRETVRLVEEGKLVVDQNLVI